MNGLDEFKKVLAEFRKLSLWAAGASLVVPFVASFLAIIPPWPAGLNVMTAIIQLVTLVVVFQSFAGSQAMITRRIKRMAIAGFALLLLYIGLFTEFTIYIPQAARSIVIGFQCSVDAQKEFGQHCPFLSLDDLASAAFDEFLLWTRISITIVRVGLIGVWFALFILLSALIGNFLIFQMRRKVVASK